MPYSGNAQTPAVGSWFRPEMTSDARSRNAESALRVSAKISEFAFCILHFASPTIIGLAGSISTAMPRHLPCLNRTTLSVARVTWPSTMAVQMSAGLQAAHRLEQRAQPERDDDLRHDRDVERTARVAGALQCAREAERDGDEQPGHAQIAQQLPSDATARSDPSSRRCASSGPGISEEQRADDAATPRPIRDATSRHRSRAAGCPAPRF